jgi:hypothetical protein
VTDNLTAAMFNERIVDHQIVRVAEILDHHVIRIAPDFGRRIERNGVVGALAAIEKIVGYVAISENAFA